MDLIVSFIFYNLLFWDNSRKKLWMNKDKNKTKKRLKHIKDDKKKKYQNKNEINFVSWEIKKNIFKNFYCFLQKKSKKSQI